MDDHWGNLPTITLYHQPSDNEYHTEDNEYHTDKSCRRLKGQYNIVDNTKLLAEDLKDGAHRTNMRHSLCYWCEGPPTARELSLLQDMATEYHLLKTWQSKGPLEDVNYLTRLAQQSQVTRTVASMTQHDHTGVSTYLDETSKLVLARLQEIKSELQEPRWRSEYTRERRKLGIMLGLPEALDESNMGDYDDNHLLVGPQYLTTDYGADYILQALITEEPIEGNVFLVGHVAVLNGICGEDPQANATKMGKERQVGRCPKDLSPALLELVLTFYDHTSEGTSSDLEQVIAAATGILQET